MALYAKTIVSSLGSHHLSNSLLFQFILSDFIIAFLEMQGIDHLCHRKQLPVVEKMCYEHNVELIKSIKIILDRLVGLKHDHCKRFSTNMTEGILTRLKMHCINFCQASDGEAKELLAMQHYAEKSWQNCMLAVDALGDAHNKCGPLFAYLEKASNALHRLGKLTARLMQHYRDDENVVFFVLRHKDSFEKAFGKRFVTKLFCRMYPKGLSEAENFLVKKYKERSFENIAPVINRLFTELEASNL